MGNYALDVGRTTCSFVHVSLRKEGVRIRTIWRCVLIVIQLSGIEPQGPGTNMKDPSSTLRTQFRVSDFISWQRETSLDLNPNFQRRSVWKKGAKSYLIDTILRGLPIPIIFLRDLRSDLRTLKARRDVVDGQQRIRTIISFITPELLSDFNEERDAFTISSTHNKNLGGKSFDQLEDDDKQRILDYQFSVHSFPSDTDDRDILQIFARMNSTGYKLNAQELRNAEWFGSFKTLAYELATEQLNRWRDWRIFTPDQIARMNEVELTSEFMLLIMQGTLEKNNKTIGDFYKKFDEEFQDAKEVASRVRNTFDTIESLLIKDDISRLFSSRTLFYALFATIYGWQYGIRVPTQSHGQLQREKAQALNAGHGVQLRAAAQEIKTGTVAAELLKATRGATTDATQRRIIIRHLAGAGNDPCPPIVR